MWPAWRTREGACCRGAHSAAVPPIAARLFPGATASKPGGSFFFLDPPDGIADLGHPLVQAQTRRVQGRASIVRQRGTNRQTIAPDRLVFWRGMFFQRAFNGPHAA